MLASLGGRWQNWKTSYLIDLDLLWIEFYHFLGKVNRRFYPREEHSLGGGRQELMLEIFQDETKFTNKTSGSTSYPPTATFLVLPAKTGRPLLVFLALHPALAVEAKMSPFGHTGLRFAQKEARAAAVFPEA